MNNPEFFALGIISLALLGNLLLALWVYADAKTKGLKKNICILLFIFTLANSGAFIFYIIFRMLLGQKSIEVICAQCHTRISNDVKFCPYCGVVHSAVETNLPKKPKKYLLISGIVIIIAVLAIACSRIISQSNSFSNSLRTTMCITTEWGNTWKMRFRTADGTGTHTFKANGENYGLIYSSNITKGNIKIDFCDYSGNVIAEIMPNCSDTLRNVVNGEKYQVVVTANDAKGEFSFRMRELK